MPTVHEFTTKFVESLAKPNNLPEKAVRHFQKLPSRKNKPEGSLMLLVTPKGKLTWHRLFYENSKPKTSKLGTFPNMDVADAIGQALDFEPATVKARKDAGLFKEQAYEWYETCVKGEGFVSTKEIKRHLDTYIIPRFGNAKIFDIKRRAIIQFRNDIANKQINVPPREGGKRRGYRKLIGGKTQANAVLTTLIAILDWYAVEEDEFRSPVVKKMKLKLTKKKTGRPLKKHEIPLVWNASQGMGAFGALVRMLLLTGQRLRKGANMHFADVDDDIWNVRETTRQKGTIERVRLPELALEIIRAQEKEAIDDNPHVFPGAKSGKPINSFSQRMNELRAKLPADMPHWTLHDLRRTARSLMSELRISREIAEVTLGHTIKGIVGDYDRHTYFDEKSETLQKLCDHIALIIHPPEGTNVVPLRPATTPAAAKPRKRSKRALP